MARTVTDGQQVPGAVGSYRCACGLPAVSRRRINGKRTPQCTEHDETLAATRAVRGRDGSAYLALSPSARVAWDADVLKAAMDTVTRTDLAIMFRFSRSRGMVGSMCDDMRDAIQDRYLDLIVRSSAQYAGTRSAVNAVAGPFEYEGRTQSRLDLLRASARSHATAPTAVPTDLIGDGPSASTDMATRVVLRDLCDRMLADPYRSDAEREAARTYLAETA